MNEFPDKFFDPCDPENLSKRTNRPDILLANMNFKDINPLLVGQEVCDPGHVYGPNFRQYYLIHYVVSGKGTFTVNEKVYSLTQGDIFIIRPYEYITYKADNDLPWHYRWVGFTCNLDRHTDFLNRDVINIPEVDYLFRQMVQSDSFKNNREVYTYAKILELFALINEKTSPNNNKQDALVDKAINFLENNFSNPNLRITELADTLHTNRSHLSTIFKKDTRLSPQQYLQNIRLNHAKSLLGESKWTIDEVAFRCGYKSSFHFSKMFKQAFGIAPSLYEP